MTDLSLRLGVMTAVFDKAGKILLSRRADLNLWTLPGGRLDAQEPLEIAAAREVYEETGVEIAIETPLALYLVDGWRRMNILFRARAVGGHLRDRTDETRGNRFFAPRDTFGISSGHSAIVLRDALAAERSSHRLLTSTRRERTSIRWKLGWRYLWNMARGKPEPRYPRFDISAIAVIWDEHCRRLLTLRQGGGRALPRVIARGDLAPWEQLAAAIEESAGLRPELKWVGVWQDAPRSRLEFVFAASIPEKSLFRGGEWTTARSAPLPARDSLYAGRVGQSYASEPIWVINADTGVRAGDTLSIP